MKMSLQEKKASANQLLDKLAEQFGTIYTEAERNFNVGYCVALMDAAEQKMHPTASGVSIVASITLQSFSLADEAPAKNGGG